MTDKVCSDWLKEGTYQHKISNASTALMKEAHYVVMKEDERNMIDEIAKVSDVIEESEEKKDQGIHATNSWMT